MEYPENADLLWRIGKAHHRISEKSSNEAEIRGHINKGK